MLPTVFPTLTAQYASVRLALRSLQPQLMTWRRQIHQRPELGFQEAQTARFICKKLTQWGIEYQSGMAKTGVVAVIPGDRPGPVLGIRADMDALPIHELNEVDYRSQHDGVMHACGHDGHVAIALGTAYYLSQHRDSFAGTVKILFQPAEEGPGGAKPMIEAGALESPRVDAMIGLHLWNNLPLGTIGVRTGPMMAATELFHCSIQGQGGHGAIPHQTVDSIVVAAQIINALQTIVSRNVDPLAAAVVTIGKLTAGTALNVIADSAHMSGTVRYFDPSYRDFFAQRLDRVIGGICLSQGATYTLDYRALYPAVVNDPDVTDMVRSVALSVVETPAGVTPDCQTMGGEDMAFFLEAVPGCYFFLGSANRDRNLTYPHHHPRFDFDETALAIGVEMFVRCVETFCVR
ncbi:M20 family metallopeptidase [Leptolyngbya sp. PCC 6406]|uniref:M20 metallopeptidase family protein n=1 Tax=Leptolyngbya sp. PCC 6406 TaxID=1173264 RepID=UPI0002AC1193|nr:M20 family metallopeptidase [Leptolyngbya sp. PCC 6406]